MSLNYVMYDVRTGARRYPGPASGAGGTYSTYGAPIWTGAEFHHVLAWLKSRGFNVYANSHYGGISLTAHSPLSWHYVKDAQGRSLGADIGTYGDVNERTRLINEVIPVLDRIGMGWHYAKNGAVPGHYDHLHLDVSNWGRKGGYSPSYGYYNVYRKVSNIYTALPLGSAGTNTGISTGVTTKRKPRSVSAYLNSTGNLVRIIQRIAKTTVDGKYGNGTVRAVKALQTRLGVRADGAFGPVTARAYMASVGTRRRGATGYSVQLIQYIAGITIDGTFGSSTENAVKQMQAWAGITQDGVFGPTSRQKLLI